VVGQCVILGSGPSLKGFDFKSLYDPEVPVFAINLEIKRKEFTPRFWVYNDPEVAVAVMTEDYYVPLTTMVFEPSDKVFPARPWASQVVKVDMNYCDYAGAYGEYPDWQLEDDLVYTFATTATTALVLAVKLGFKHIRMLGVDLAGDGYYEDRPKVSDYTAGWERMRRGMDRVVKEIKAKTDVVLDWPSPRCM